MAISPFMAAINQLCEEKALTKEIVIESLEAAVAAAYRKDYGNNQQVIRAKLNPETGEFQPFQVFSVVKKDEFENEHQQKILSEAKKINKKAKIGGEIEIALPVHSDFGRIAAQTAKQVIIQRLREAEREVVFNEYKSKEGEILNGIVQQIEGGIIIINLGRTNGLLLTSEQIPAERYYVGQRLKFYCQKVEDTSRGPRILVSRTAPELIKGLFIHEVPELQSKAIEIKTVAREAGNRSKVAVITNDKNLDPVGTCVGQRGTRVQAVLAEIGDEKIDIVLYSDDEAQFIINALSPAKVSEVKLKKKTKLAEVIVPEDQLSLAIGKNGQNVRLASKLVGWEIDIIKNPPKETKAKKEEKSRKIDKIKKK